MPLVRALLSTGVLCALALTARAQIVELRATINQAQETPATGSPATGTAIMFYNVGTNTFDLLVSISGLANTATASHIHEGAPGVSGPVVTGLGAESVYTRSGNTLTATFRDVKHLGKPLTLLQGGAYFNIHSAQFPGGEVRGQLIPRPVRLYAVMDIAQEQVASPPTVNLAGLNDSGGAVMLYDPATNTMRLRLSVFNFANTFNNSHFHAEVPGKSGPVVVPLGNNPNAGGYTTANGFITGSFDIPMTGVDPIGLLLGGTYLNFHSTTFGGGELRGQVLPSTETAGTRFSNIAVRGFVGTGDQVVIQGFTINGPEPIRALITAKGPSLAALGVAGALPNPRLQLFDAGRRQIAVNDDFVAPAAGSELAAVPGLPANSLESALIVVLPPGNYTAIVSASAGTGIALLEVSDLRTLGGSAGPAVARPEFLTQRRPAATKATGRTAFVQAAAEICAAPLAVTTLASR